MAQHEGDREGKGRKTHTHTRTTPARVSVFNLRRAKNTPKVVEQKCCTPLFIVKTTLPLQTPSIVKGPLHRNCESRPSFSTRPRYTTLGPVLLQLIRQSTYFCQTFIPKYALKQKQKQTSAEKPKKATVQAYGARTQPLRNKKNTREFVENFFD